MATGESLNQCGTHFGSGFQGLAEALLQWETYKGIRADLNLNGIFDLHKVEFFLIS